MAIAVTNNDRLAEVLTTFDHLGFESRRRQGGVRRFAGTLNTSQGAVAIEVGLADLEFTEYPAIRITTRPAFVPQMTPHISVGGSICYFAQGTVILDRYRPGPAIALCIKASERLLNDLIADPKGFYEEALDEFLIYWAYGQSNRPFPILIGDLADRVSTATCYRLGGEDDDSVKCRYLVSERLEEVTSIAKALGNGQPSKCAVVCWLFTTDRHPALLGEDLPTTIGAFLVWLKVWAPDTYKDIAYRLEHDKDYLKENTLYIVIRSAHGRFGIRLRLDDVHRLGYQRRPATFKHYLHTRGKDTAIQRLDVAELGGTFIINRNLQESASHLGQKRITLIGCGAIGGYLAQGLVRLGAGSGRGGTLTLIDGGTLGPENLGRHYLGYPDLFKSKAGALRDELTRQFPEARVEAREDDVVAGAALFNEHLVVNATGEEAVSEMINDYHMARFRAAGRTPAPVLHTWIKGAGEGVQALWVDSSRVACFRCLKNPHSPGGLVERHKFLRDETPVKRIGCQALTPYAVSSPMAASALTLDMIAAWLNGDVSPRFRTRAVETANVFKIPNKDLQKIDGCPACHPRR